MKYNLSKETNSKCELSKASNPANVTGIKDVINEAPVDEPNINPANNNSDGDSSYENRSVDPFAQPQQPLEDTANTTDNGNEIDFSLDVFNDDEVMKPNTGFDKPENNIDPKQVFELAYGKIATSMSDDEKEQAYMKFETLFVDLSDEEKKMVATPYDVIDINSFWKKNTLESRLTGQVFPQ